MMRVTQSTRQVVGVIVTSFVCDLSTLISLSIDVINQEQFGTILSLVVGLIALKSIRFFSKHLQSNMRPELKSKPEIIKCL
ncbi:hypothetical protein [Ruegeria sp. SCP11]|uniref:hypothetical protein n=1 Tax=Ruegeria sp. SCP11 TaxID=3141378 RepID=UPI00333B74BE